MDDKSYRKQIAFTVESSYLSIPNSSEISRKPHLFSTVLCAGKKMESSKWQGCVETKVMAPLDAVWKITSAYYELHKWFPGMKSCERVEGTPEEGVGSVRLCKTPLPSDQEEFVVEELIALDDTNHSFTYRITDTNIPGFNGYQSTFQVSEAEEKGNCLLKWSFEMDPAAGHSKEDTEALLSSILSGMAKNLEQLASSQ